MTTTTSSGYSVSTYSATGITNSIANNINTLTMTVVSPTQSYMNSTQTLRFYITTTNYLASTDYLLLVFPTQYLYLGTAGTTITCTPYNCTPSALNPLNVKVTSGFQQFSNINTFNFTINNFLSPNTSTSDNFQIYSYEANNSAIDQINTSSSSAQASFSISCTLPCQTCSGSTTNCTSCYSSPINTNTLYYSNNCYQTCPNITYLSGISCMACVSPCKTCSSVSLCTSCVSGYYYYTSNTSCITECPSTYYGDSSSN